MRRLKFGVIIMAVLFALAVFGVFTACGGSDDGNNTDPPGETGDLLNMPVISIATDDGADIETKEYAASAVSVRTHSDSLDIEDAVAEVKVRGNDSANYEKKPFRIKFDQKQSMLGLNGGKAYKSWVLLALYKDASLLRDAAMLQYGRQTFKTNGYYCSDSAFVELYVNGDYRGVYLLAEQQQVNEGRVGINEPAIGYTGTDIGYFIEYDGYYRIEAETERFTVDYKVSSLPAINGGTRNIIHSGYVIKNDVYSTNQRDFIQKYTQNVFEIAYRAAHKQEFMELDTNNNIVSSNKNSAESVIESVIDLDSLVDTYIMQDICVDPDLYWSSFFMTADMSAGGNKKLTFEAPWDFDITLGIYVPTNDAQYTAGGNFEGKLGLAPGNHNPWTLLLWDQDWFQNRVEKRWDEIRDAGIIENMISYIDGATEKYSTEFSRNYERWPASAHPAEYPLGIHMDPYGVVAAYAGTQAGSAKYLIDWIETRIAFLDTAYNYSN